MLSFSFCSMTVHVIRIFKLCLQLKSFSRGNKKNIFTRGHKVLTASSKCVKQWVWCIIMVSSSPVAWRYNIRKEHLEQTIWSVITTWFRAEVSSKVGRGKGFLKQKLCCSILSIHLSLSDLPPTHAVLPAMKFDLQAVLAAPLAWRLYQWLVWTDWLWLRYVTPQRALLEMRSLSSSRLLIRGVKFSLSGRTLVSIRVAKKRISSRLPAVL